MSRGAKDQLAALSEADVILDLHDKGRLAELLGITTGSQGSRAWSDWPDDPAVIPYQRDRAFLKIQDGCDASCSYCVVPAVRGCSRSLSPVKVLDAVRRLMESGSLEVVLSGIHLGQYGRGLHEPITLEKLLSRLIDEDLPGRVRLSSIEPLEITEKLVSVIGLGAGFICRHIHIPVQSGSDRILASMGRPYTRSDLVDSITRLQQEVPGIGVGCDIICGFPGETMHDFAMTEKIISDLKIPFVHAFPYSPRPGTKASYLNDSVSHNEKKNRVRRLRSIADKNRVQFAGKQVGSFLSVALESGNRSRGPMCGLTDNYLRVEVTESTGLRAGDLVDVLVVGTREDKLEGRPNPDRTRG
jgi:threonylcarbamoyladenosine tRNA methylthiotransferase MtaB